MDPSMMAGAMGGGGMGGMPDPSAGAGGTPGQDPMASHSTPGKRQKHKHAAKRGHKRHKGKKKK
jgi:hypothetical protein